MYFTHSQLIGTLAGNLCLAKQVTDCPTQLDSLVQLSEPYGLPFAHIVPPEGTGGHRIIICSRQHTGSAVEAEVNLRLAPAQISVKQSGWHRQTAG